MSDRTTCELCGEPMPTGEEMFKYHGYSGPCPKVLREMARDTVDRVFNAIDWRRCDFDDALIAFARAVLARQQDGK